jgi:hypothetical protein
LKKAAASNSNLISSLTVNSASKPINSKWLVMMRFLCHLNWQSFWVSLTRFSLLKTVKIFQVEAKIDRLDTIQLCEFSHSCSLSILGYVIALSFTL